MPVTAGANAVLPAPSVRDALDDTLPGAAAEATVVVPAGADLRLDDLVIVTWAGFAGAGTVVSYPLHVGLGDVGKPYDYRIKEAAIAANAGRTVNVSYEVVRADGSGRESSASYRLSIGHGSDLAIDTCPVTIAVDATLARHATGGTLPYTYSSDNTASVIVLSSGDGTIKGAATGQATITVVDSATRRGSDSYKVTVVAPTSESFDSLDVGPIGKGGRQTATMLITTTVQNDELAEIIEVAGLAPRIVYVRGGFALVGMAPVDLQFKVPCKAFTMNCSARVNPAVAEPRTVSGKIQQASALPTEAPPPPIRFSADNPDDPIRSVRLYFPGGENTDCMIELYRVDMFY